MHYEHHRYVGKVCVVTGAANGLGLNLVNRLVEEGALVGALDLERIHWTRNLGIRKTKCLQFHVMYHPRQMLTQLSQL